MGQSYPMSEADREIQSAARALADELQPHEVTAELHGGELPDGLLEAHRRRVAELGFEAINMPKELGGGGLTAFEQVLVQEQIGRVTNALGWVVHTPASWLPKVASQEQLDRWVVPPSAGTAASATPSPRRGPARTSTPSRPQPPATATATGSTGSSGT